MGGAVASTVANAGLGGSCGAGGDGSNGRKKGSAAERVLVVAQPALGLLLQRIVRSSSRGSGASGVASCSGKRFETICSSRYRKGGRNRGRRKHENRPGEARRGEAKVGRDRRKKGTQAATDREKGGRKRDRTEERGNRNRTSTEKRGSRARNRAVESERV